MIRMYRYQNSLAQNIMKEQPFNYSWQSPIVTLFWLHQKLPSFFDVLRSCLSRFIPNSNLYFHHCQMYSTLGWINLDDRIMFPWLQFSQKASLVVCPPTWLLIDYIPTSQLSSPWFSTQCLSKLNFDKKLY